MNKVAIICESENEYLPNNLKHEVFFCGVGKINATFKTYEIITTFRPDIIVNFSSATAINPLTQGLIEVSKVLQYDMCPYPLAPRGITPFTYNGLFFSSEYPGMVCGSGDTIIPDDLSWLRQQDIDVIDTNLYAIAYVCDRFSIPWRSFKYVNSGDDGEDAQEPLSASQYLLKERLENLI